MDEKDLLWIAGCVMLLGIEMALLSWSLRSTDRRVAALEEEAGFVRSYLKTADASATDM